jgi:hypothetical protein
MERGGWSRDRTGDTRIFSPLLYQLSYPARPPAALAAKVQNACSDGSGKHKSIISAFPQKKENAVPRKAERRLRLNASTKDYLVGTVAIV